MAEALAPRRVTRRTFLGWWLASLLTATVITGLAPILVYFWPAPPKGQKKGPINIALQTPIDQLLDGNALHGPAEFPLSHLTWKQGPNPSAIEVDGIVLGF